MICPPTKGQGCASGLFGMKNKMITDAPIDATISGWLGQEEKILVIKAIKKIEQKQAINESIFALVLKLTGSILKYLKI